jgi:hypothetical protein
MHLKCISVFSSLAEAGGNEGRSIRLLANRQCDPSRAIRTLRTQPPYAEDKQELHNIRYCRRPYIFQLNNNLPFVCNPELVKDETEVVSPSRPS